MCYWIFVKRLDYYIITALLNSMTEMEKSIVDKDYILGEGNDISAANTRGFTAYASPSNLVGIARL